MSGSSVGGFGPSFPSTDVRLFSLRDQNMLKRYVENQIKRCLSNPAILVIALVCLSSSGRRKSTIPYWATQSL